MLFLAASQDDAEDLRDLLDVDRGLRHLRVRERGGALTVESGPDEDPVEHVRLRRVTRHEWTLEIAPRMGRRELEEKRAPMSDLVLLIRDRYPWALREVE